MDVRGPDQSYRDTLIPSKSRPSVGLSSSYRVATAFRSMLGRRRRVSTGLGRAVRQRYATRSFTRTQQRRQRPSSGQGVTDHFDKKLIYRKKRMPRRMRKRWRGFVKKVTAVSTRSLGTKTVVYNKGVDYSIDVLSLPNAQQAMAVSLYGVEGDDSSMIGYRDLNNINDLATSVNTTGEIIFCSAILDLTVTNTNHWYDGTTSHAWSWKNEVDVYEISFKCELERAGTAKDILSIFSSGCSDTGAIGGGTAPTSLSQRGLTPWDVPQALSQYKGVVWKKTKFEIGWGQTFTYQIRDPRNRLINKNRLDKTQGGNMPGWTRYLLILSKPVAGFTADPNTVTATFLYHQISIGATRKYSYKVNQSEARQSALAYS